MDNNEEVRLFFMGRPAVQKNNLDIRYKKMKGRKIPFIGHSKALTDTREGMSYEFREQYEMQGFDEPIDHLFEIDLVFYVPKQSEPDLDNLPAVVLDALQGVKVKGTRIREAAVIKDDKLLRVEHSRKVVKGDADYAGEPRTEVTIRRYEVPDGNRGDATRASSDDNDTHEGS